MSRIYFHSEDRDAEVRGSERAHMGVLISNLTCGILTPAFTSEVSFYRKLLPQDHYLQSVKDEGFRGPWETYLRVGWDEGIVVDGNPVDVVDLALNTALALGGSPLRLFAQIHGRCEVHCWVAGEDRRWLSRIIEDGLQSGLYRKKQGWDDVIALLRESYVGPVVCSYSVSETFPDPYIIGWASNFAEDSDELFDAWEALGPEKRWAAGVAWLPGNALQLSSLTLGAHFGRGLNAFNVLEGMYV